MGFAERERWAMRRREGNRERGRGGGAVTKHHPRHHTRVVFLISVQTYDVDTKTVVIVELAHRNSRPDHFVYSASPLPYTC